MRITLNYKRTLYMEVAYTSYLINVFISKTLESSKLYIRPTR